MFRPTLMSAEQLAGVKLFGQRDVMRDGVRVSEPAQGTKAVKALLRVGYIQDDEAMMRIFADAGMTGPGMKLFTDHKVVVRLPPDEGGGVEAMPFIPGLTDDNLSCYAGSEVGDVGHLPVPVVVDERPLIYKLNAVFTDVTITDKLQLSPRRIQAAKRLAVSDPAAAASSLTEYLRDNGFPRAKVVAGDYAKTLGRAREYIRQHANAIVYKDSAAPALVTGGILRMSFDGFVEKQDFLWTVMGPLKYATEVQAVYQMAIVYGPDRVMFFLAVETVMLGINIYNEVTDTYYTGRVKGYSSLAGIRPMAGGFPSELTADQQSRLAAAARKISPVMHDGLVIGSAVHVSDRHIILNEHTLVETADQGVVPSVCGRPIHESQSVAHDICMVKRDGIEAQWLFRQASVGERVVLCFSVGDTVEYSEVLRVLASHGEDIVLSESNVLRKGASGAAVVALRDSALLGIFSTKRGPSVVCAAFSSAAFSIVADYQSIMSSDVGHTPGDDVGDQTYERMVKRGLLSFLEGIADSCAPVYYQRGSERVHAGLVANCAGSWVTTVDPNVAQVVLGDSKPITFRSTPYSTYMAVEPPPVLSSLPNTRVVQPGERVFLFTKSDDIVVMSLVRVVTHCLVDMNEFVVEDFGDSSENLVGGLIVAEKDAAVLGQYLRSDVDSFGAKVARCVALTVTAVDGGHTGVTASDSRALVNELHQVARDSDARFSEFAAYGNLVVDLVAGQGAHARGVSLAQGILTYRREWSGGCARVLSGLGWPVADRVLVDRYGEQTLACAFLAVLYLHDSAATVRRLRMLLAVEMVSESTPTLPDFPFPRSSSVDSLSSARTHLGSDESAVKIQDLENRLEALAALFRARVDSTGG